MSKKIWLGFIAVFVVWQILEYLINGVILQSTYMELQSVWRPEAEMQEKMWLFPVMGLVVSYMFSFIFSKGYEAKGIAEGARYGLYIGLMMSTPMALAQYVVYPITESLAVQWFIYSMVEFIIGGIILAVIFGMKPKQAAPTS